MKPRRWLYDHPVRRSKIIRHGITRTVFLVGSWAIKVPSGRRMSTHGPVRGRLAGFAEGYLANLSELTWGRYEDWQGKVAPILHSWLFGVIQVYRRCEPMPEADWRWTDGDWSYHGDLALPYLFPELGDVKPDNFGILNGRVVRLDYVMH